MKKSIVVLLSLSVFIIGCNSPDVAGNGKKYFRKGKSTAETKARMNYCSNNYARLHPRKKNVMIKKCMNAQGYRAQ